MDQPTARSREHAGLRVDEHPQPGPGGRTVAELRTDVGESHEPPHLHGVSRLLLTAVQAAAAGTGADVRAAVTLERSAIRVEGAPHEVADALGAVTAALADVPRADLDAARRQLADLTPRVTPGAYARSRRFGTAGHGLSGLPFHGVSGASDDDVRSWARRWHGGTTHVTVLGDLPDFAQHLPADGPTPAPPLVANLRTVPGTAPWPLGAVAITWLGGSMPEDRAVAVLVVDRLRTALPPGSAVDTEVELLEPGTQHVTVLVRHDAEDADELARTAVAVVDALAGDGPTEVELGRAAADGGVATSGPAVAAAARRVRDELLVLLPGGARGLDDLPVATVADPGRLSGEPTATLRPALWTRDRRSRLDLHADGVRLDREDVRLVADRGSVVALLRRRDGTRSLQLRDGREATIDPAVWRGGTAAVDHVDRCFAAVAVDAEPAGPPPADLVAAATSRRWLVAAVAGAVFVPLGLVLIALAFTAPMPGRLVLVPLALAVTAGVVWVTTTFARERSAAADALRQRRAAADAGSTADRPGGHQVRS